MPDVKKLLAEFIGTAILVVVAVGVATQSFELQALRGQDRVPRRTRRDGHRRPASWPRPSPSGSSWSPWFTPSGRSRAATSTRRSPWASSVGAHEAERGRGVHGGAGARRDRRRLPPLLDVHDPPRLPQASRARDGRLRQAVTAPPQPGRRVPHRDGAHGDLRPPSCSFATHKAAIQGAAGVAIGFGLVFVHLIGIPLTGPR